MKTIISILAALGITASAFANVATKTGAAGNADSAMKDPRSQLVRPPVPAGVVPADASRMQEAMAELRRSDPEAAALMQKADDLRARLDAAMLEAETYVLDALLKRDPTLEDAVKHRRGMMERRKQAIERRQAATRGGEQLPSGK